MKELEHPQYHKPAATDISKRAALSWGFSIWPYRTVRIFLSAVFFVSGISKLISPESFAIIIEAYGIIPESWVIPVSIALPGLEVLLAIGLLLDIRGSLAGTAALLALFMAILGYGIHMGLDVDCGCFGPEDPEAEAFHGLRSALYRDGVMALAILYLYLWRFVRPAKPVGLWRSIQLFLKRRCE
ncbi:MAG TPA: MauE/DoxX family redox-associated membrane protein [Desulfobacteria bacterium]|nr:MauE/DoxX family redox-associated membrane protein [Desulfobacteria bacterium]